MKQDLDTARALPRDRAFVLQLTIGAAVVPDGFAGRVEHVTSGAAAHFETLDECLGFIARVLHTAARDVR